MRIPPRSTVAISLLVVGGISTVFGAEGLWGPAGAYLVAGVIALLVGVLLGVSE